MFFLGDATLVTDEGGTSSGPARTCMPQSRWSSQSPTDCKKNLRSRV